MASCRGGDALYLETPTQVHNQLREVRLSCIPGLAKAFSMMSEHLIAKNGCYLLSDELLFL